MSSDTPYPFKMDHPAIRENAVFYSFDEFRGQLNEWMAEYNLPFRVASSERLKDENGVLNDVCRYRYIVYHCVHYGVPRKRGKGKRPNQNYVACGCTATIRLNYSYYEQCLKITTFKNEHVNHEISADAFALFMCKREKIDAEDTPMTERKVVKRRYSYANIGDHGIAVTPNMTVTPKRRGPRAKRAKLETEERDSSSADAIPTPDDAAAESSDSVPGTFGTPLDAYNDNNEEIDVVSMDHPAPPPNLPAPVARPPAYNSSYMPYLMPQFFLMAPPYPMYNFSPYGQNLGMMQPAEAQLPTGYSAAPIATPVFDSDTDNKENEGMPGAESKYTVLQPVKSEFSPSHDQNYATLQPVKSEPTLTQGCDPDTIKKTVQNLQNQLLNPNLGAERQAELQSLLDKWANA